MTLIVEKLDAEGVTQAQVQEEADAAGITISPEFQAEMDKQGISSGTNTAAPAMVIISALVGALAIFA